LIHCHRCHVWFCSELHQSQIVIISISTVPGMRENLVSIYWLYGFYCLLKCCSVTNCDELDWRYKYWIKRYGWNEETQQWDVYTHTYVYNEETKQWDIDNSE
jgi:hypothetical protein